MAAGHLKVSSSNTSNKSAIFADFYEINKHQDRRYLSYDGKRFRWAGNLESLGLTPIVLSKTADA